jgi:hypothetical protein
MTSQNTSTESHIEQFFAYLGITDPDDKQAFHEIHSEGNFDKNTHCTGITDIDEGVINMTTETKDHILKADNDELLNLFLTYGYPVNRVEFSLHGLSLLDEARINIACKCVETLLSNGALSTRDIVAWIDDSENMITRMKDNIEDLESQISNIDR